MTQRCDDPQCPAARIPNHAHMTQAQQDELANLVVKAMAEDLLPTPLKHEPVEGYDFMPSGWCGGCETCISYPVPTVCVACSYSPEGGPMEPVTWPCEHAPARLAAESTETS